MVKAKKHPTLRFAKDFYVIHHTDRRSFLKYYNRYKQSRKERDLLPRKRGPRYKTRRTIPFIENKVIELRQRGNNRYEIHHVLKPGLKRFTPSPSGIYNIFKRNNINRLKPVQKAVRRKIISKKAGELAHIDTHHLSRDLIMNQHRSLYLVCIVDGCSRVAWARSGRGYKIPNGNVRCA